MTREQALKVRPGDMRPRGMGAGEEAMGIGDIIAFGLIAASAWMSARVIIDAKARAAELKRMDQQVREWIEMINRIQERRARLYEKDK